MNKKVIYFINTLKNISLTKRKSADFPYSSIVLNYADCLYREGFLQSYEVIQDFDRKKIIRVVIRLENGRCLTNEIKFISSITKSRYLKAIDVINLSKKNKEYFLSTSLGIFSLTECKRRNMGGLIVFSC